MDKLLEHFATLLGYQLSKVEETERFAQKVGVSSRTIFTAKKDLSKVSFETLVKIAKVLDLDPIILMKKKIEHNVAKKL
jgi:DNA-binding XRE family transcriptional regulator